jgi:hypothetical protein
VALRFACDDAEDPGGSLLLLPAAPNVALALALALVLEDEGVKCAHCCDVAAGPRG